MDYDVMVIGSGIGGMESSIKLGDMGYKVLLVEKEASVGGRMILLSKVFPTLDCASCISGPKMSSTINHPNITTKLYSEVMGIQRDSSGAFHASVREKSTFVDWAACTGCSECQTACTVAVPDEFNAGLVARRAAYIAFPQAVPKKAVITRAGTSPCVDGCPAGIKAHGYVSLIRSGKYEEAFQLILDATPLVGTLGRACYAPCETECTRGDLEATIPRKPVRALSGLHPTEKVWQLSGLGLPDLLQAGSWRALAIRCGSLRPSPRLVDFCATLYPPIGSLTRSSSRTSQM
jgi:ferredoxin